MAALKLLVELRQRHGQPAPETSSEADRKAFEQLATDLLTYVRNAISAELTREQRADLELVEAAQPESREALLLGQVSLARRLPDYWQRFEAHEAAHARARLEAPASRGSWLGRLLGS